MAIKIPARNYLTFSELQERWQCTENDLRYAIISGAVKPSIRLVGKHKILSWEMDAFGDWVASAYEPGELGYALEVDARGWQYLQDPVQTESFDCEFRFAADEWDAEKGELPFAIWRKLNSTVNIGKIKESAVFLLEEIARYEAKFGDEAEYQKPAKPLATRERYTLLTIIAALCKEAKIDIRTPSKAGDLIQSLTDSMAAPVAKRTIEEHLKKIPDALASRMR